MAETFTRWDAADSLKTDSDISAYLDACIEEDPGDGSLIRAALNDIVRARNISQMARDIGISREGLYKALSNDGNPSFTTILKILQALELDLRIMPHVGT
ncbi:MAG: addiction module antidote protein [Pseudomonadota bacterium]|nr:addiction module antidote protein [Pseudomonadota bacterium]